MAPSEWYAKEEYFGHCRSDGLDSTPYWRWITEQRYGVSVTESTEFVVGRVLMVVKSLYITLTSKMRLQSGSPLELHHWVGSGRTSWSTPHLGLGRVTQARGNNDVDEQTFATQQRYWVTKLQHLLWTIQIYGIKNPVYPSLFHCQWRPTKQSTSFINLDISLRHQISNAKSPPRRRPVRGFSRNRDIKTILPLHKEFSALKRDHGRQNTSAGTPGDQASQVPFEHEPQPYERTDLRNQHQPSYF